MGFPPHNYGMPNYGVPIPPRRGKKAPPSKESKRQPSKSSKSSPTVLASSSSSDDDPEVGQEKSESKASASIDPSLISTNSALRSNPTYKDYYVSPSTVLKHFDKDLLNKLGKIAYHALPFSETYSDHPNKACNVVGPSTVEMYLSHLYKDEFAEQHKMGIRLLHENSAIARELGWTDFEHAKMLTQAESFMRDVFSNQALEVEVCAVLSALGTSLRGGFCHIDHGRQALIHLDADGPSSTIVHTRNPRCANSLEYLLSLLSCIPDSLVKRLQADHDNKIQTVCKAVGVSASTIAETYKKFQCSDEDQKQPARKKKDAPLSSEADWASRSAKQHSKNASPFIQKLAVLISRLQYLSGNLDGFDSKSVSENQKDVIWELDPDSMYREWGGLLCLDPRRIEAESLLIQDKAFSITQMPQHSATKFCGSIHTNPTRTHSRAMVLVAASEKKDAEAADDDGEKHGYTGAEQITPLHLLSSLYQDLLLGDANYYALYVDDEDGDLFDWLHMIFFELMFQNVRSVDLPDLYYYLNRCIHQDVFYSGILPCMTFTPPVVEESDICKLYERAIVSKGKKGGKKLTSDQNSALETLQQKLLSRAKAWIGKSGKNKEKIREALLKTHPPKIDAVKGDDDVKENEESEIEWLSYWKHQIEMNTFSFKMHPQSIDVESKKPAPKKRRKRATRK